MTRPYENLINAIVLQAVKDYRDALKRLKKKPQNTEAMRIPKVSPSGKPSLTQAFTSPVFASG